MELLKFPSGDSFLTVRLLSVGSEGLLEFLVSGFDGFYCRRNCYWLLGNDDKETCVPNTAFFT